MPVTLILNGSPYLEDHLVSLLLDMNVPKLFYFSFLKAVTGMDTPFKVVILFGNKSRIRMFIHVLV